MNQTVTKSTREPKTDGIIGKYRLVSERILFWCFGFQNRLKSSAHVSKVVVTCRGTSPLNAHNVPQEHDFRKIIADCNS